MDSNYQQIQATATWEGLYLDLKEYQETNGHLCVRKEKNLKLYNWIEKQRKEKHILNPHQIEKLSKLNFVWTQNESLWEVKFFELKDFKEEFGHCKVAAKYNKNKSLGAWVSTMRCSKNKLSQDKIDKLNDLGFIWDVLEPVKNNLNLFEEDLAIIKRCFKLLYFFAIFEIPIAKA